MTCSESDFLKHRKPATGEASIFEHEGKAELDDFRGAAMRDTGSREQQLDYPPAIAKAPRERLHSRGSIFLTLF